MVLQSYAHGSDDSPLLGVTVGQLLDEAACRWPDQDALIVVDQGVRWTWRELRERARTFAAGLLALGLEPGDRVGMLAPNRAEWIVTQFGTAYAGLVLVNINPAYRTPELEYALDKVGCRGLITESTFKTSDYLAMMNELAPELAGARPGDLHASRLPELRIVIRLGDERTPGMFNFGGVTVLPGESAALVAATDIFATVAELAGVASSAEDSVSMVPYFSGQTTPLRQTVYAELFVPNGPMPFTMHRRAIYDGSYKLIRRIGSTDELYDLRADPFEQADLFPGLTGGSEAQIAYDALVTELVAMGVD